MDGHVVAASILSKDYDDNDEQVEHSHDDDSPEVTDPLFLSLDVCHIA